MTRTLVLLALCLAGCGGAAGPALRTAPVLGYYTSPDWGKCVVGGVRLTSVGAATITAHGCVRLDALDASVTPIAGLTPLGGTAAPFADGGLVPVAAYPDAAVVP